jgi:hypothetical protein
MKSAREWMKEGMRGDYKYVAFDDRIKMVQSDALRHAADTVYGNMLLHGDGVAAQKSIAAIIEEAEKLEAK